MAIDICTDPPCTLTHTHERQAIDYPTDTPRGPPTHKTITGLVLLGLVSVRCDDTSDRRIARLVKADEDTVRDAIHRVNEIGLAWHPDVPTAQRRERARIRREKGIRWGRPAAVA